jgi:hypothetical protein
MPRLSSEQRRLVCAQARLSIKADRAMRRYAEDRWYWIGQSDGIEAAIDVLWPRDYRRLTDLAKRIARRYAP